MRSLSDAIQIELLKLRRSNVFAGTILAMSLAPVMGSLFVIVLRNSALSAGNTLLKSKASMSGFSPDWPSFLNLNAQAIGVGGVIVFGFVAAWVFGREYANHTVKDLFVLPISRAKILLSKMVVIFFWSASLCAILFLETILLGNLLSLPGWSLTVLYASGGMIIKTSLMVISLTTLPGFVACLGRGYLASLSFVVLTVVLAQIVGALGYGAYFPWAIPAIYSKILGTQVTLNGISMAIPFIAGALGYLGAFLYWKYFDQPL